MPDPNRTDPGVARSTVTLAAVACLTTGCPQSAADNPADTPAAPAKPERPEPKPEPEPKPKPKPDGPSAVADPTPNAEAPDPSPSPALAPGWARVELSTVVPRMTGTIDVPPGVRAERVERQDLDADGLDALARGLSVGAVGLQAPAIAPPPDLSPKSRASSFARFKHVATHEFGDHHWAVVQAWRPGECMMNGWSAAAGLTCGVFKAPCDEIDQWVQVCASLRPGAAPNASPVTPQSAFPTLEEAAAKVATTAARAVVRNDAAKLLSTLGPKGVEILGKTYTAEALQAALTGKSVLQVVAPIFADLAETEDDRRGLYGWNSHTSAKDTAQVWFSPGYGEQPYFKLSKLDGTWAVTEFDVEDLGEP